MSGVCLSNEQEHTRFAAVVSEEGDLYSRSASAPDRSSSVPESNVGLCGRFPVALGDFRSLAGLEQSHAGLKY